jgi:prolipoprotein diacylglyceryltransferase
MARKADVDELIREAFEAEDAEAMAALAEPGLPDLVVEMFRSRLRWYGAMFLAMILLFTVLAVVCAVRFLGTEEVPEMIRWGAGFFLCFGTVLSGKLWYWMQMERVAMTREIKRVELLVAHLAVRTGTSRGD